MTPQIVVTWMTNHGHQFQIVYYAVVINNTLVLSFEYVITVPEPGKSFDPAQDTEATAPGMKSLILLLSKGRVQDIFVLPRSRRGN